MRSTLARAYRLVGLLVLTMLAGCSEAGAPDDETSPVRADDPPRIVSVFHVLDSAHLPTLDPSQMTGAEIEAALGESSHCHFKYTSSGQPVLALNLTARDGEAAGVIKLNDKLVILKPQESDEQMTFTAGPVRLTVAPEKSGSESSADEVREAEMIFEVGDQLRSGYRGYYQCDS
jgi:hypothetical protein